MLPPLLSSYCPEPSSNLSTTCVGIHIPGSPLLPLPQTWGTRGGLTSTRAIWEHGRSCSRAGSKSRESRAEQKKGLSAGEGMHQ